MDIHRPTSDPLHDSPTPPEPAPGVMRWLEHQIRLGWQNDLGSTFYCISRPDQPQARLRCEKLGSLPNYQRYRALWDIGRYASGFEIGDGPGSANLAYAIIFDCLLRAVIHTGGSEIGESPEWAARQVIEIAEGMHLPFRDRFIAGLSLAPGQSVKISARLVLEFLAETTSIRVKVRDSVVMVRHPAPRLPFGPPPPREHNDMG